MLLAHDAFGRLCHARDLLRQVREQRLSIPAIAREAGMSTFHFIRRFEALFGLTPHQFRIQARLDDAKLLLARGQHNVTALARGQHNVTALARGQHNVTALARGQHNVTEVCFEVGFESLGTFSDLFARRVGMAPSAYQRSARIVVPMPAGFPPTMFPGCLSRMGQLPASAFRNFQEA